jgi:hypothetical protein
MDSLIVMLCLTVKLRLCHNSTLGLLPMMEPQSLKPLVVYLAVSKQSFVDECAECAPRVLEGVRRRREYWEVSVHC